MGTLLSLLGSFSPLEWGEEAFVEQPPFILENNGGSVFAAATNPRSEAVFDALSKTLGLKKRRQGHTRYFITKTSSLKAFRDFGWIVRRSWRDRRLAVLWAVVYLRESKGWSDAPLLLDDIAEHSGCSRKQCAEAIEEILPATSDTSRVAAEYKIDRQAAEAALKELSSELPSRTEELIMRTLCSGMGGSASEVYERVMSLGLGMSTTYKTLEKLKKGNYIHPLKHYRVNEKGPMRELLVANCGTCFYGYASPQRCLSDTLRQMEGMIESYYGKKMNEDERDKFRSSVGTVPYSSKLSRRVCDLLALMHQVDRLSKEGGVSTILAKIEESYGMEFPAAKPKQS